MKVYIVTEGTYEDYSIVKVFASKDDAEFFAEELRKDENNLLRSTVEVEEWDVYNP